MHKKRRVSKINEWLAIIDSFVAWLLIFISNNRWRWCFSKNALIFRNLLIKIVYFQHEALKTFCLYVIRLYNYLINCRREYSFKYWKSLIESTNTIIYIYNLYILWTGSVKTFFYFFKHHFCLFNILELKVTWKFSVRLFFFISYLIKFFLSLWVDIKCISVTFLAE